MKKQYFFYLLACFLTIGMAGSAQNVSNYGKEFWVGFMRNHTGADTISIRIASKVNTNVLITAPKGSYNKKFTVKANKPRVVNLPKTYEANAAGIRNIGLKVVADDSITVFASNYQGATFDATVVLPTQALGKEYRAISYTPTTILGPSLSEIMVVAAYDNTVVDIIPPASTGIAPFTITINAGQVYNYESNIDLTGTLVRAANCKNFAVFGGVDCTDVPASCYACDHLYEQIPPVNTWGKTFIPSPFVVAPLNTFRVVSAEDSTTVVIDDGTAPITTVMTQAGQFYEFTLATTALITSDKPIGVTQYAQSYSCSTIGDPFMVWISPIEQNRNHLIFSSVYSSGITGHYVNVVMKTKDRHTLKLNGDRVPEAFFNTLLIDTTYSYAQLDVDDGFNTLEADSGFNAYVYGFGDYESYGYSAGSNLNNLNLKIKILSSPFSPPNTFCINKDIEFSSYIKNPPIRILWEFGDGTTSTDLNPKHSYSTEGTYTVSLKAFYTSANCESYDSVGKIINTIGAIAAFKFNKDSLLVNFYGTDTLGANKWLWDFGDRSPLSSEQNPVHEYLQKETFTVTLIVWNECGSDTVQWDVTIDGTDGGGGTVGIAPKNTVVSGFLVYPNPFNNELTVDLISEQRGMATISITDVLGREVYHYRDANLLAPGYHTYTLQAAELPGKGWYSLTFQWGDKLYTSKLVLTE